MSFFLRVGLLCLGCVSGLVSLGTRERIASDAGWRFALGEQAEAWTPGYDDAGWRAVTLPHDWSIEGATDPQAPTGGDGGYFPSGIGWYRRAFTAPETWRGQRIAVEFEGTYMNATVWINGIQVGWQPYGYTGFEIDLTPFLHLGEENTLAVRCDNSQQPNSRWYTGSGLYRHVWLHVTAPVHLARGGLYLVTEQLSAERADVRIDAAVRNDTDTPLPVVVETTLLDPSGRTVAVGRTEGSVAASGEQSLSARLTVADPRPWSPETPTLYRAVTRVAANGRPVDEVTTLVGLRTIRVSAERGFELNGQPRELVGGNAHHDHGLLGAASFDRAEERKAELLKAAGFTAVRTSHNPPAPAFLAACDRLGLLVVDEAFDGWRSSKTAHDYGTLFEAWSLRDLEAMIRRDRNHPSVVLWSIGNEVYERGTPAGEKIAQDLTGCIRALDSSRPVTIGLNGMGKDGDWTKEDPVFATLDVAGYNYEIGRHAADHARLPARVIMAAESYLSETFANWAIAHDHAYVIGDFVWSALDYLGEAGIGRVYPPDEAVVRHWEGVHYPWHGAYCGDIDLTGWRKPISHYRAVVWDRGEKLYAAVVVPTADGRPWNLSPWSITPALPSWTWPGKDGVPLEVEVYSRHDAVRLFLNGELVGEQPTGRAQEFKARFRVPYRAGRLEVVGVTAGRESERVALVTAGPAVRLRATADRSQLRADGQDLAFVTLEVVDQDGVVVPTADLAVQYALAGEGTIAGIGSGDVTTRESYRANPRRVHQGRALVVLRTTERAGSLHLRASAPGLVAAEVSLETTRVP